MADELETLSENDDIEPASDQDDDDNDVEAHVMVRP